MINTSLCYDQYKSMLWSIKVYAMINKSLCYDQYKSIIWSIQVYAMINTSLCYDQYKSMLWSIQVYAMMHDQKAVKKCASSWSCSDIMSFLVTNLRVLQNAGHFLTSWGPVSFSGRTLLQVISCWMFLFQFTDIFNI
jgi:hypothetical protein